MENKHKASYDFLIAMVTILFGLVYGLMAFLLPRSPIGRPYSPSVFPTILAVFMVLMGLVLLLKSRYGDLKLALQKSKDNTTDEDRKAHKMIIVSIISGLIYALIFDHLGYVLSTLIFMMINLTVTEPAKRVRNLVIASIFSFSVYYVFFYILGISLPMMPILNW